VEYVLIGVGGTGARVLEAFTYLSAAGVLGGSIPKVHMRMIEMDTDNGNLNRLKKVLESYNKCHDPVFSHVRDWHTRRIIHESTAPFVWQIGVDGNANTLAQKFNQGTENKELLFGLYGSDDLDLPLEEGCRGRPRVGALEYAKRFQDDIQPTNRKSFWNNLFTGDGNLQRAIGLGQLRVMLVGSMFGGSGASGVPNLAKLIKSKYCTGEGNAVGLTLMSPFFNYNDVAIAGQRGAESTKFMINSKAALLYYDQSDIMDIIHSLYVVGGTVRPMKKADGTPASDSTGSKSQCNPAMPALLVAALAALDFFSKANDDNAGHSVVATTGHTAENEWRSYPYGELDSGQGGELKKGIQNIQRLTLLWRLINNKVNERKLDDWEFMYKPYSGVMNSGKSAFDRATFLENTTAIREFFLGQENRTSATEPWNVGVEGFLQELERNGMGTNATAVINNDPVIDREPALNISDEINHIDNTRFDDRESLTERVASMSIRDLYANFISKNNIKVKQLSGDDHRRAKFIAGATAASLL
jgi:hypothetical protein